MTSMGRWRRTTACERALQWISLDLDGEASELETAALRRHLGHCEACAAVSGETAGFTELIRLAPPAAVGAPVAVAVPHTRRARIARRTAATLVLAAALGAGAGVLTLPHSSPAASSNALGLATPKQRLTFAAAEGLRAEPKSLAPTHSSQLSPPFASRVLS